MTQAISIHRVEVLRKHNQVHNPSKLSTMLDRVDGSRFLEQLSAGIAASQVVGS
jgi:hypothetical protein